VYYGIWLKGLGGASHTGTFDGPFDMTMSFFFYVPNLLVAEYFIRRQAQPAFSMPRRVLGQAGIVAPVLVLQAATWLFAHAYWLVHIGRRLAPLFV